ncbi:MAG: two-component system OmpR family sensor kinase [Colwellia sp.]|jgi:two-component system OmpR family sensor kinase
MFFRLLVQLFFVLSFAVLLSIITLDALYIEGVKKDELNNTRGIDSIVFNDVMNFVDKNTRLTYWSQRFNYKFSLKPFNTINLLEKQLLKLKSNNVFVDIESGFVIDDIDIYYYHKSCSCVLILEKTYSYQEYLQTYILCFLFIIILSLAIFIFYYAHEHKKQVNQLAEIYKEYGEGNFLIRANESMELPYTPLAKTFNKMADEIKLLIEEQKTLVNGVSHDLKTPIARIRFALDMTRSCKTTEQFRGRIQDMDFDLDELEELVNEWLFYAELNGKPEKLQFRYIDLKKTVQVIYEKTRVLYPHINFELSVRTTYVEANYRLVSRAIENLLINAGKFARSQVRVTILGDEKCSKEELICILVEDDGPGIPKDSHHNIVQPFVKLDTSRNTNGFGLGLAIVKSILDKHQSTLEINTSSLGGAAFLVTFKKNI